MERGRSRKARSGCLGRIFGFVLFLIVAAVGVIAAVKYMPSRERADLDALYAAGGSDRVALYLNYERQEESGVYVDGQTYLPATWVDANLNERFYWDANEEILVYALPEEIVKSDETTVDEDGKKILYRDGDAVYLSLALIQKYTDVRLQAYDGEAQKRVFVENNWDPVTVADAAWSAKIRLRGGLKSPIVTEIKRGGTVTVLEQYDNWARVMTPDGHIGYMHKWKMKNLHEETLKSDFTAPVYQNISLDQKIVMVWHQVTIAAANQAMDSLIAKYGGVTAQGIVESALDKVKMIEDMDYDHLVISIKSSDVMMCVKAHEEIAKKTDYPLHVGITESGTLMSGNIKSAVGLGIILYQGIGDTIRVSLTGDPVEEIKSARRILKTLGLRKGGVEVVSCPTCGRTRIDLIGLANRVETMVTGLEGLDGVKVAVMGCVVNGPGEAKEADIGIAGGIGEGLLIKKGEIVRKVPEEQLLNVLKEELTAMAVERKK